MTLEEMKQKKKEYGYTYEQIANLSGVPLGTVQKIFGGVTESPRYETLLALEQLFQSRPYSYSINELAQANMVCEPASPYLAKRQGEYTVDDYFALPDDYRAELIDGVFYDMATPLTIHQLIVGEIYLQLKLFVKSKNGSCLPLVSPMGVQLDCDNKTMVEPDVLVVCDRTKVRNRNVYGAPDFVVEVLSPSNRKKDTIIKLNKYLNAGVREFWLVDPEKQHILVYDFASDNYPVIYGFDAEIPVAIWNGECKIDLREMLQDAAFLYEDDDN